MSRVLQCVAVCCSVVQCVVVPYSASHCVAVPCNALQYVLQCVAVCVAVCCSICCLIPAKTCQQSTPYATSAAVRCSAVHCATVCCSVLQCAAVCCSVLQYMLQHTGEDMPTIEALCDKCVAAVPLDPDHDVGSAQLKLVGADPCCSVLQCVVVCCSVL